MARIGYLLLVVVAFLAGVLVPCPAAFDGDREYLTGVVVREWTSSDKANRFFDLAVANDLDGSTNRGIPHIGVIVAKDSRLAAWLSDHDGKLVALSLRAGPDLPRDGESK